MMESNIPEDGSAVTIGRRNVMQYVVERGAAWMPSHMRRLLLYHICKQLMTDHEGNTEQGVYSALYQSLGYYQQAKFLFHLADALHADRFSTHAARLLREHNASAGYERWKLTLSRLEDVDPDWRDHTSVCATPDGIQLDMGGYRKNMPFSASIILHDGSYGKEHNLYEILPLFDGKNLSEVVGDTGPIMGWLPLEKAVAIAHATLHRDEAAFRQAVATAYQCGMNMAINDILVIEPDKEWQSVYGRYLPEHFPGATVQYADTWGFALGITLKRLFDLYITNFPGVSGSKENDRSDLLQRDVTMLRRVHPDANIALVTGRPGLNGLATELGIGYFLKQSTTLFADIAAHYAGRGK